MPRPLETAGADSDRKQITWSVTLGSLYAMHGCGLRRVLLPARGCSPPPRARCSAACPSRRYLAQRGTASERAQALLAGQVERARAHLRIVEDALFAPSSHAGEKRLKELLKMRVPKNTSYDELRKYTNEFEALAPRDTLEIQRCA